MERGKVKITRVEGGSGNKWVGEAEWREGGVGDAEWREGEAE